jgi:hypothetical protein
MENRPAAGPALQLILPGDAAEKAPESRLKFIGLPLD